MVDMQADSLSQQQPATITNANMHVQAPQLPAAAEQQLPPHQFNLTNSDLTKTVRPSGQLANGHHDDEVVHDTSDDRLVDPKVYESPSDDPSKITNLGPTSAKINGYLAPIRTHNLGKSVGSTPSGHLRVNVNRTSGTNPLSASAPSSRSPGTQYANPDCLHVQRTYHRISYIGGIPGDGFVDGVELTRDKKSEEAINGYLEAVSPIVASGDGFSPHASVNVSRKNSAKAFSGLLTVDEESSVAITRRRRSSNTPLTGRAPDVPEDEPDVRPQTARKASNGTHYSAYEDDEAGELRLLQLVDRYGFFAPNYGNHTKLVRLDRTECLKLPSSLGKRKASVKSTHSSKAQLSNPYIQHDSPSSDQQATMESRRASTILPSDAPRVPRSTRQSMTNSSMSSAPRLSGAEQYGSAQLRNALARAEANSKVAPRSSRALQAKEVERIDKWFSEMLVPAERDEGGNITGWRFAAGSDAKLRRRIAKGIPDRWRAGAWQALLRRKQGSQSLPQADERSYREAVVQPSNHDVQIDLDVPRTISGHLYFHTRYGLGQRGLFNVLHATGLLCSSCGYCQGMGSVAATFLCYLPPESAYAAMVSLHDVYGLHRVYEPGFPGMLQCFAAQELVTRAIMPEVASIFDASFISVSSFATKWYITLFATTVAFSTQLRIWDLFMLEGLDVLVITATAIIWVLKPYILSARADFESILSLLSSYFVPEDEDAFLRWIKRMLKRDDCRALIASAKVSGKDKRQ